MTITPARANTDFRPNLFSDAVARERDGVLSVFPSYFRALTQFSPRTSPRALRIIYATLKPFAPLMSLVPSESRGV
jgi:hypothetical protein